ncbi:YcxB family protein, partial [Scardovia wiggsiae]
LAYSDIPAGQRNRKLNSLYTHKLPYTTLYGLHESKGYYYISVTYNTVYAIRKSDCSPNAQAFLRNLKTAVDSQKR